ncbi:MAG: chaperone modulator CbpM [Usitatibacteraceae bacterium]
MQIETYTAVWLEHDESVSMDDLIRVSGLTTEDVHELVDIGALTPADPQQLPWIFSATSLLTVRKAARLRDELELDTHALALALSLLWQIQALESEIAQLRARQR